MKERCILLIMLAPVCSTRSPSRNTIYDSPAKIKNRNSRKSPSHWTRDTVFLGRQDDWLLYRARAGKKDGTVSKSSLRDGLAETAFSPMHPGLKAAGGIVLRSLLHEARGIGEYRDLGDFVGSLAQRAISGDVRLDLHPRIRNRV